MVQSGNSESDVKMPNDLSLGPHGLGDPNDRFLRRVEKEVLIPKKMREKSRAEKCQLQVEDFNACVKEAGLKMVVTCQEVNKKLKDCLTYWYTNPQFINECTEEYLKERSEYRATGLTKKQKARLAEQTLPPTNMPHPS